MDKAPNREKDTTKSRGEATSSSHEAAYALWMLWRLWKQYFRSLYKGKCTLEQHFLLRRVGREGSMTVSELAEALGITPGAATIATRRLEKAGLLKKERSGADQRVVTLSLTPAGKASLDQLEKMRLDALIGLLDPLNPDEKLTLTRLIQKVTYAAGHQESREIGGDNTCDR